MWAGVCVCVCVCVREREREGFTVYTSYIQTAHTHTHTTTTPPPSPHPQQGEQQREVVRVTVTCCLHERAYNPYYAHLLMRLIKVSKAHAVTLRYCLWDHCRALEGGGDSEGGPVVAARRAVNLSRLMASMIAGVGLPLLVLKVCSGGGGVVCVLRSGGGVMLYSARG